MWHFVLYFPFALLRGMTAFLRPPSAAGIPRHSQDAIGQPDLKTCADPKLGLAFESLSNVRHGLSGHSEAITSFSKTLVPGPAGATMPPEARASVQEANLFLEELVENTFQRLKLLGSNVLSAEQSRLGDYRRDTNAFGRKLDDIPNDVLVTHVVAELLRTVGELRCKNEAARHEIAEAQSKLQQYAEHAAAAEAKARVDALTRLPNRRAFDELHVKCQAASQATPYCLVLMDIDHFKRVNDQYGHVAGDAVLALFGRLLRENCRTVDHLARWGGEEFAILLPGANLQFALASAENLRRKAEAAVLHYGPNTIRFTISCGIVAPLPGRSPSQALEEADNALFAAKQQGRNRCVLYSENCRVFEPGAEAVATRA